MINNLPIKNRASEVESFSAAAGEDEINLSSGTTDRLWAISKKYRVTLSTIIQAAWAVLLSRYSREQDVLFGVTVSGRPPAINGVESMVGLFINTLPLRAQVRRGERVSTWLQDLQSQAVETRQYEYSSLVNIQQWSEIPSGTPLFDSILVFENYPVDKSLREQNLSIQFEDIISSEKTNYPLTLVTAPSDNLLIKVSYDQNAFDHTLIRSLLGHIKTILQSIAINPEQLVGDIEILSDAERDRLLFGWSRTEKGFHEERSLQAIFESQVEKTPLGVAVEYVDGDNKIQFAQSI
jgi:non-ribosomal peptide synthetase component F